MDVAAIHAASLADVQDEAGDSCPTFTFDGATYKCLPGGAMLRKPTAAGGFSFDADLTITALASQFSGSPDSVRSSMVNSRLTYLETIYRIESVVICYGGKQLRIFCNHSAKGA